MGLCKYDLLHTYLLMPDLQILKRQFPLSALISKEPPQSIAADSFASLHLRCSSQPADSSTESVKIKRSVMRMPYQERSQVRKCGMNRSRNLFFVWVICLESVASD